MLGRTPHEAWNRYAAPLQQALGCIAPGRFVLQGLTAGLRAQSDSIVTLNDVRLVPLKGPFSVHIGRGLLASPVVVRLGDFHRAHIPTGYIDFTAIVRFAIVELGVDPLAPAWESILEAAEPAFDQSERGR